MAAHVRVTFRDKADGDPDRWVAGGRYRVKVWAEGDDPLELIAAIERELLHHYADRPAERASHFGVMR